MSGLKKKFKELSYNLLNPNEIQKLSKIRPLVVIFDTFKSWILMLICFFLSIKFNNIFLNLIALIVITTQLYSLLIIAHDGMHRRLFHNKNINDLWNDFFILGFMGAITRINNKNHLNHHLRLCEFDDPDRYKYQSKGRSSIKKFFFKISSFPLIFYSFKNIFITPFFINKKFNNKNKKYLNIPSYSLRDLLIIFSCQTLIFYFFLNYLSFLKLIYLWFIPIALAQSIDILRVFSEHSRPMIDEISDQSLRLANFKVNFMERLFFSPHNMNFHATHHLWTSIPYYNLRKATTLVEQNALKRREIIMTYKSYFEPISNFYQYVKSI